MAISDAAAAGLAARTLKRQCETGQIDARKVASRGRGGFRYEVKMAALPLEVQARLWTRAGETRTGAASNDAATETATVTETAETAATRPIVEAPDPSALTRLRLTVQPEDLNHPKNVRRVEAVSLFTNRPDAMSVDDWAKAVADKYGVSRATIYRWADAVTRAPSDEAADTGKSFRIRIEMPGLANGQPVVRTARSRTFEQEFVQYALGLIASRNGLIDIKSAYEHTLPVASQRGWSCGSLQSFYRLLDQLTPLGENDALWLSIRGGDRKVLNAVAPYIRRDETVYRPLEMLVGDQKVLDFLVYDDVDGQRREFQPQIYLFEDFRTRYLAGWAFADGEYNRFDVAAALRMACTFGIFGCCYNDNGKPETSAYVSEMTAQLKGYGCSFRGLEAMEADGVQRNARAYNARTKPNERMHRELDRHLLNAGVPGYCRRRDGDEGKVIADHLRLDRCNGEMLHVGQFHPLLAEAIAHWNRTPHRVGKKRIVPEEEFFKLLGQRPAPAFPADVLNWMMLPPTTRKVNGSRVTVGFQKWGARFAALGSVMYQADELAEYQGREVEVRVNPREPETAYLVELDTHRFIATARMDSAIDPKNAEAVRAGLERQRRIVAAYRRACDEARELYRRHAPTQPVYPFSPEWRPARDAAAADRRVQTLKLPSRRSALNKLVELYPQTKAAIG